VNTVDQALATPTAAAMTLRETMDGLATARISGNAFRCTYF
jgi:hypothetical protein